MANSKKNDVQKLAENPMVQWIAKAVVGAFIVGGAWQRLEYKMDKIGDNIIKKLDLHMQADNYEKEALRKTINDISGRLAYLESEDKDGVKVFLKPEDVRLMRFRRGGK